MSQTKTAETSTDFGTLRMGRFPMTAGGPGNGIESHSQAFTNAAEAAGMDRLIELFRMSGMEFSPEESRELNLFDEFLARHVQPDANCDVQCMLLWNEWVRVFRRRASGFPNLIREKEFRYAITGKFGAGITTDGWRGTVYYGVRYVP